MLAAFRADASIRIGTGHVMRCLSLAHAWAAEGGEALFLCRSHQGHLGEQVQKEGFRLRMLPENGRSDDDPTWDASPPHAEWLGTHWKTDAGQVQEALAAEGRRPDWLIVDHYALDGRWEENLRPHVGRILAIDDLADRTHTCDALLDQNLYPAQETRYDGLVPAGCRTLLGPRYALLRPEFAEARAKLLKRGGALRRLFVFLGGADPTGETGKALEAIALLSRPDLAVDAVAGASNPHLASLPDRIRALPGATLHVQVRHMADLMARADAAIGAGGTSTWERCCLSLPSLCITIAENQRLLARTAHENGLLRYIGHHDEVTSKDLAIALAEFLDDPEALSRMGQRSRAAVDGLGARHTASYMAAAARGRKTALRLRPACPEDLFLYYAWANDPDVRANAFSQATIPLDDHEKWFFGKLAAGTARLFVLEADGIPCGQIRFDPVPGGFEIDFSVARSFRGLGLSKELLTRGIEVVKEEADHVAFIGKVKERNAASAKAFESAGFAREGILTIGGEPCRIYRLRRAR